MVRRLYGWQNSAYNKGMWYKIDKLIEIKDLNFSIYDEENKRYSHILKDINLNIYKKEYVVILGKNGSGKSTLVKHFNGMLLPTMGDVFVKGINTKDNKKSSEIRQRVGMVFQNPDNQIVSDVVEEDVAFGLENLGIPREKMVEFVDNALKNVGMYDFKKGSTNMLSGGQKQRVAIAGILAMSPECIVFDEPTSMLDPVGRKEVNKVIYNLNKENGTTVVLITHNIEEIFCADRVIIMEDGHIVSQGTPEGILSGVEHTAALGINTNQVIDLVYELRGKGFNASFVTSDKDKCADMIVDILEEKRCR